MTAKHTPGPWAISGILQDDGSISIAKDRIVIAYTTNACSFGDFINATLRGRKDFGAPDTAETQWANARLIAAAPTLLAELVAIVAQADAEWEAKGGLGGHPGFDAARAAIKSATGEPSPSPTKEA